MIRGGLRTRLILDSVRYAILSTLQQQGWFDPTTYDTPPGTRHHQPFRYVARPVDWAEDIRPNAIAISGEDLSDEPVGFGGEVQDIIEIYVDIFAQDDPLGWQVAYDIRDSLYGKGTGAVGPQIDIYDVRQSTPSTFTTVDLDLVEIDRSQGDARQWQRHWFMIHLVVLDDYDDEFADQPTVPAGQQPWASTELVTWERIREAEQHVP